MNYKKILEGLKQVFNETPENKTPENNKFSEVTTKDGVTIVYDGTLEQGTKVKIKGESGELMEAPDGEHELNDMTIVVKSGEVIEIKKNEKLSSNENKNDNDEPEAEANEIISKIKELLGSNNKYSKQVIELSKKIDELKEEFSNYKKENDEASEKVNKKLEKFGKYSVVREQGENVDNNGIDYNKHKFYSKGY